MATKEFDELTLDGTNYPIWASDIKINFASRGILNTIEEPNDGDPEIEPRKLNTALFLLRLYIHKDLKHEYMLETSPLNLWKALKERYDQQKELIWPEANYEWVHLCLQDFKTMAEYNHAVHNIVPDCRIPKHLVLLYQKSLKDKKSSENPRFEAHFNLTHEERPEVASSHQAPVEPESNLNVLPEDVAPLSVIDDMFIKYCSTDPLGDLQ
uniref:Retrotransposon protein, putative, Ty1-copia subclass n=1 Tax=Oryza sativa subsp. japonica TaxID=39947 RepID=Q10JW6_ORYSJ|nr:retrotransposon protein, putative, Ty1-copia subclass [Oryza sativa Japonica Group]